MFEESYEEYEERCEKERERNKRFLEIFEEVRTCDKSHGRYKEYKSEVFNRLKRGSVISFRTDFNFGNLIFKDCTEKKRYDENTGSTEANTLNGDAAQHVT